MSVTHTPTGAQAQSGVPPQDPTIPSPVSHQSVLSTSVSYICFLCNQVMDEKAECLIIIQCKHSFHTECIQNHLSTEGVCPVCKTSCQLSDLQRMSYPKKPPNAKGKPRGAMAKHYNTRSHSRNLFQETQSNLLDASNLEMSVQRTPNNTQSNTRKSTTPNVGPDHVYQPVIDYNQINALIETNLKILQSLNLASNLNREDSTQDILSNANVAPSFNARPLTIPGNIPSVSERNQPPSTGQVLRQNSNNTFSSSYVNMHNDKITSIIQNWGLKFDGSSAMNVDEFLYRVRALTNDNFNGDFSLICKNLHILLTDTARRWFWRYHKQVDEIVWEDFCQAIRLQYKNFKSSFDIREEIRNRKQKPGESFDAFFESVSSLMDRLSTPLSETELIEIVSRNLRPEVRHELLYINVQSIPHLRKLVQMRESFINDEYVRRNFTARNPNISMPRKQISEIMGDFEHLESNLIEEQETAIEAIQQSEKLSRCWNCDEPGHHWEDCLCDRSIFCYGCGAKNTYKPQCQRCIQRKPKNFKSYVPAKELN